MWDRINNQAALDILYNSTCDTLLKEMDLCLHFSVVGSQSKKRFKNSKPFWDKELTKAYSDLNSRERAFIKYRGTKQTKSILRVECIKSRNTFDKLLRKKERIYKKKSYHLECISVNDHQKFWQTIKSFGSKVTYPHDCL